MNYMEYITSSLAKSSTGATISVGIFALVGIYALLGLYFGIKRGFTQSVIRFFTVGASAIFALIVSTTIASSIVLTAVNSGGEGQSVEALLESYSPELVSSMPSMFKPMLSEVSAETAAVFVMMFMSIVLTPVFFIVLFYVFKLLTMLIYKILAGFAGAISYGKGYLNTILGGVVGLAQGLFIAAVIIVPVSGLCNLAVEAKEPLLNNSEEADELVLSVYDDVIDDLADNPLFDLVDKFGGGAAYNKMVTVQIGEHEYNMGDECIGVLEIFTDMLPVTAGEYNWKHPTDEQKAAFDNVVEDVGHNELISSLTADVMRGFAATMHSGEISLGLSGAPKALVNDVMGMFSTSTKDTVEGDLRLFVDIYFIMCDRDLSETFASGDSEAIRDSLIVKDENGVTPLDEILDRLNQYDRAQPIVTSFTKLSLTVMMGTTEFDENTQELYDNVKEDITTVLNHNKSDYETEEEYKEAVSNDLDKALADNNIEIADDVKQNMVDYIADNYGDHEGEITEKEINDALLSYYHSYANAQNGANTPETPENPENPENPEEAPSEN